MPVLAIERRGFRIGIHFYRWGLHLKMRTGTTWRHVNVKFVREWAYGKKCRRALWVGWWASSKGCRGGVSGFKLAVDRVSDLYPSKSMKVPIYPRKTRERDEPFQVL